MTERIPLAEQLDEIAAEYTRRCRAYPILVARGEMRAQSAEMKIERIAAAHNTLAWLARHADQVREWMQYAMKISPADERAAIEFDAPVEVEQCKDGPVSTMMGISSTSVGFAAEELRLASTSASAKNNSVAGTVGNT